MSAAPLQDQFVPPPLPLLEVLYRELAHKTELSFLPPKVAPPMLVSESSPSTQVPAGQPRHMCDPFLSSPHHHPRRFRVPLVLPRAVQSTLPVRLRSSSVLRPGRGPTVGSWRAGNQRPDGGVCRKAGVRAGNSSPEPSHQCRDLG